MPHLPQPTPPLGWSGGVVPPLMVAGHCLVPGDLGHSDWGVSQLPCCLAAGRCPVPCDLGSLGQGGLPASSLFFSLSPAISLGSAAL